MLILDISSLGVEFTARLPKKHADQIGRKIQTLLTSPYPPDSKTLVGFPLLRVHAGEYRIIYQVYGDVLAVVLIGRRNDNDVYRRLKRIFL